MATGRKIVDEADARRCLKQQVASGRPLAAWARSRGIDARSLNLWRVNLERWSATRARGGLVELVPSREDGSPRGQGVGARYLLEVGTVRVAFGDDFTADSLRRIVGALGAC
jgi:hypothetical protein